MNITVFTKFRGIIKNVIEEACKARPTLTTLKFEYRKRIEIGYRIIVGISKLL